MKFRRIFATGAAVLAAGTIGILIAESAGNWSTLPIYGSPPVCVSTVSGVTSTGNQPYLMVPGSTQGTGSSICGQTMPAGPPALLGTELIPVDTGIANSASPQTAVMPNALVGSLNPKVNLLIGGDFATNLWQRGITFTDISPSTATMTADRWFAYSSTNGVTVTKQTGVADTIPTAGLYASLRAPRAGGVLLTPICIGQYLDKEAFADLVGKNAVLSFEALAGAGFSAANSNLTVTIAYDTAADSSTPGTNTATFAAGTITGYTAAVSLVGTGTAGSVASGVATIPISTTWTTYSVVAPIPTVNASGTAITSGGITFCWTPVGTGSSTDWFEIEAVQLQGMPNVVSPQMPAGVLGYTGFQRRPAAYEALLQLSYSYVMTDGAATTRYAMGQAISSGTAQVYIQYPEEMREIPTLTVGTTISYGVTSSTGSALTCATSIAAVASTGTEIGSAVLCSTGGASLTAGNATQLIGANTGGLLTFSAEP